MITVDGVKLPWRKNLTVSQLLAERDDDYDYAVVRMNRQIISRPNFNITLIPDQAEITLIPMVAGG